MNHHEKTVAYIVGNDFETIAQLPNVYTIKQFFSAILENCLPTHRLWIVGQGIHAAIREILSLCEKYRPELHFHFGSLALNEKEMWIQLNENFLEKHEEKTKKETGLEWRNFHFVDSNRVKADLKLVNLSENELLTQDFILTAAREISEKACRQVIPTGKLLSKTMQINSFHRFFPLPITVETQFQLMNDNTRSLKSLTRFYQDYSCLAEANLSFDFLTELESKKLLQTLGEKTFGHFSEKLDTDDHL